MASIKMDDIRPEWDHPYISGDYHIEAEWRIHASINYAIIGSDNGLSPDRRQAIIWINAGVLLIVKLQWNFIRNWYIFIHENPFKIVVWKKASIFSRCQ